MKKLKLIALIYSSEDKDKISKWLNLNHNHFEISSWSSELTVPIQSAVSHYSEFDGIDGLVIDDYFQYDPIVMSRISDCLRRRSMALFSASSGTAPAFAAISKIQNLIPVQSMAKSPNLVRAS